MERKHPLEFGTIVPCGKGADAYEVLIEFPMSWSGARIYLKDRNHPDFKGKEDEELVAEIVKRSLQSTPTMVTRLKNGVMNDGPKGEPAYQLIQSNHRANIIKHYKNGKIHDSRNGEAAFQVFDREGRLERAVHYTQGVLTMIKEFQYTNGVVKEEETGLRGRLKRIFSKAAAPPAKELKECNVRVEYRSGDRLITDGPHGKPGLQLWQIGYEGLQGLPLRQTFGKAAKLIHAQHYKDGKPGKEASFLAKQLLRKPWPAR